MSEVWIPYVKKLEDENAKLKAKIAVLTGTPTGRDVREYIRKLEEALQEIYRKSANPPIVKEIARKALINTEGGLGG